MDEVEGRDARRIIWLETEPTKGVMSMSGTRIMIDVQTGVQYLCVYWGNAMSVTLMVDRDGKPLISDDERVWR